MILKNPAWAGCAALGVACAFLLGLAQVRGARLEAARAEIRTVKANYDTAMDANKNLGASLDALTVAHDDLIGMVRADTAATTRAAEQVQVQAAAIRTNAERIRALREEINNATPSCAELAQLDIAAACPALADSLRYQARGQGLPPD